MTQRDKSAIEAAEPPPSSMVALRTIIIIAFLVAIPLMAVFGTGLPTSLRTAMQGPKADTHAGPAIAETQLASSPASLAQPSSAADLRLKADRAETVETAPSFSENMPLGAGADRTFKHEDLPRSSEAAPKATITGVRTADASPRARITQIRTVGESGVLPAPAPAPTAPLWAPGPRTAASPRVRSTAAHYETSPAPHREAPASSGPSLAPNRGQATASWQATAYSQPADNAAASSLKQLPAAETNDPFARGERQLRKYGATHYRLESWGDDGQLFRCSANVALPHHRSGARHFEATAASPSQAIHRLLEKVEAWRAAER